AVAAEVAEVQTVGDDHESFHTGRFYGVRDARTSKTLSCPARYNVIMASVPLGEVSWERMIRAVEKVRERLLRATAALEKAGVPYAVVGGNAVASWVSAVDEAAVRNTRDVDILLRRSDLDAATAALAQAGF